MAEEKVDIIVLEPMAHDGKHYEPSGKKDKPTIIKDVSLRDARDIELAKRGVRVGADDDEKEE